MTVYFQPVQDIQISTRASRAQYQYTLVGTDAAEVATGPTGWPTQLRELPRCATSRRRRRRAACAHDRRRPREGRPARHLDAGRSTTRSTMRSGSGRSPRSTAQANQYRVILEARRSTSAIRPRCRRSTCRRSAARQPAAIIERAEHPAAIDFVPGASSTQVPLDAPSPRSMRTTAPLAIAHQEQFPSVTISFNLAPGAALGDAVDVDRGGRARDRHADVGDRAAIRATRRSSPSRSPASRG